MNVRTTCPVAPPVPRSALGSLSAADVLAATPRSHQHLEALGLLLSGARVYGADPRHCVIWNRAGGLAVVQGNPPPESIAFVLESCPEVRTIQVREASPREWTPVLSGWHCTRALRLVLDRGPFRPPPSIRHAEFFDLEKHAPRLPGLPESYRDELLEAHAEGPVAISLDGDSLAAYCFAGWRVLSFFDLCVNTLPGFRRQGHALACCSTLIASLRQAGQDPQWVTLSSNRPSLELARRLGFRRLESLLLFKREPCPD